ncbi:MAG: hypothetical protein KJ070_18655 [Verrucomicrobia bacterium]|nr:hypothetical protein [Verrucomicrobiota bacterium]
MNPAEPYPAVRLLQIQASLSVAKLVILTCSAFGRGDSYPLEVLPPEHRRVTDPKTRVELLFLTTAPEKDVNLYFHEHSWLADESVILFTSARTNGGLMGYVTATGDLIRFHSPRGGFGGATAAARGNSVLAVRGREIVEIKLAIRPAASFKGRSSVTATERVLWVLPDGSPSTALNPSCDGKYAALGVARFSDPSRGPTIYKVNLRSGALSEVCRLPEPPGYGGHVQWRRTNPNLLSFAGRGREGDVAGPPPGLAGPEDYAGRGQRLWVVDIRKRVPRNVYLAAEGELVTHESWWVNDQILFCGAEQAMPPPAVLSHVKTLDVHNGEVRIVGAGSWWPEASPSDAARLNWWHASGSADGRWIAADNWHGDIMLFEGRTTRPHLLTSGHRTYGQGEHPHVGWDRSGEKVVFASHLLGDLNVCVAFIPTAWQAANADDGGLRLKRRR